MKTLDLEIEVPDTLDAKLSELIEEGWFTSKEELTRLALAEFVQRHRFELQEKFQREDIAWALGHTAQETSRRL